jgi:hypothetical protein
MKQNSTSLPARRKYLLLGAILFAVGGLAELLYALSGHASSWVDWFEPFLAWGFGLWFFLEWRKHGRKDDHVA